LAVTTLLEAVIELFDVLDQVNAKPELRFCCLRPEEILDCGFGLVGEQLFHQSENLGQELLVVPSE